MTTKKWLIDRRTCLKGLGVAIALPLLETMGWAETPKAGGRAPVRLAFMYHPCGINTREFWPTDAKTWPHVLPPTLAPLRGVIDQCLLLGGLNGQGHPYDTAGHWVETSQWLTGAIMDGTTRDRVTLAPSADQIAASQIGIYTALPSLELGTQSNEASGTGQGGFAYRYCTTLNYRTATQPLPVETNPAEVMKRLFSSRQSTRKKKHNGGPDIDPATFAGNAPVDDGGESLDRSMLDLVREEASGLRARISINDQRQLDEYLDSVRTLEKRVAAIERQQVEAAREQAAGKKNTRSAPLEVKIPTGTMTWSEHVRVLGDLMILAFQADITRIATLVPSMNHGISYPELGFLDNHHELSHHVNNPDNLAKLAKIDRFSIEQYAYLVARMKSVKEGAGTLLDHTMFHWGSGLNDGNGHEFNHLPVIIAGRGGGSIRTGRFVPRCSGNHCDLLMGLVARTGATLDKPIGNGTRLLPDLS